VNRKREAKRKSSKGKMMNLLIINERRTIIIDEMLNKITVKRRRG